MPEFELKAWIQDKKRMVDVKTLDSITGDISYRFNNVTHYATRDEVELLKYTRLKDKNNKKIFDGDIIRVDDSICHLIVTKEDLFLLMWLKFDCDFDENDLVMKIKNGECEIIGNAYENPELLEASNE